LLCRHVLHGETAALTQRRFAERSIGPDRLLVRRVEPVGMAHLRVYDGIDVALDTFPWCGHTTACEALWMGVPVRTPRGVRHAGRMPASALTGVGLQDLVADTPDAYRRLAVALAYDEARRAGLRATMRDRMLSSPLCDGAAFTRRLEDAYRTM